MYAFREGYTAMKGGEDVRMKDEWGMTVRLKDNLAWFHTFYVQWLSYLNVLKIHFMGELIS